MSESTETPQQRQARIRQQRREAKINASAQERLDKITKLSGRTPETMRNETSRATPPESQSSTPVQNEPSASSAPIFGQSDDPEQVRLQEEYMRALLSGAQQGQTGGGQQRSNASGEEDPMLKMMQAMLGNMSSDPNAPAPEGMPFSADEISKMTGLPSFLTGMFLGGKQQAPPSPKEIRRERVWNIFRIFFSIVVGLYTIFIIDNSIAKFGQNPPAPATAQSPFTLFLMGELLFHGARTALSGRSTSQSTLKSWIQMGRSVGRDGAILVFVMGCYSWWKGYT